MEVYLASANPHKFGEFVDLVAEGGLPLNFYSAAFLPSGMPPVEETEDSFSGNARLKAEVLLQKLPEGSWALADDSGLCVDALDGAPGILSARYAGEEADSAANNAKLLAALDGKVGAQRSARFTCSLVFLCSDGECQVFEGNCKGHIITELKGGNGFGYDPLFVPDGYTETFAELGDVVKNTLSHRALAVRNWLAFLRQQRESQPTADKYH